MAIFNPTTSSLFMPTVYAFGGVLSAGLAAIMGIERGRISRILRSSLSLSAGAPGRSSRRCSRSPCSVARAH